MNNADVMKLTKDIKDMLLSKGKPNDADTCRVWLEDIEEYGALAFKAIKWMRKHVVEFPQSAIAVEMIKAQIEKRETKMFNCFAKIRNTFEHIQDDKVKIDYAEGMMAIHPEDFAVYKSIGGFDAIRKTLLAHNEDALKELVYAELNKCTEVANV